MSGALPTAEATPGPAAAVFGARLDRAEWYAGLLCTDGIERGLIGPREAPVIWERHILNSAALAVAVPPDCDVVDLGSGAGLPGIPLALARPDLRVTLVEPMQRRVQFLTEVVASLDLLVGVVHARAQELSPGITDVVVARAVAPLDRLLPLALPLLRPGGRLLALKGRSAVRELADAAAALRAYPGARASLIEVGEADMAATVVLVQMPPASA